MKGEKNMKERRKGEIGKGKKNRGEEDDERKESENNRR